MGKSTAADFLRNLGVATIDTDVIARQVVEPGQPALEEIRQWFGDDIISPQGELRRDELARRVFSDDESRRKLEDIVHPKIRTIWTLQVEEWRRQGFPLAAVIIPLLYETDAAECFDLVVCVACSLNSQRERLLQRGWSPGEIARRNAAQRPIEEKMLRADYVIWSDVPVEMHGNQWKLIVEAAKN